MSSRDIKESKEEAVGAVEYKEEDVPETPSRRKFLGTTAVLGLSGAGLSAGLTACGDGGSTGKLSYDVPPGQLDEYYSLYSGGHSGEVRIIGEPSGREIMRIPVFNPDPMSGWGITNESKKIIGTKRDGSLKYTTGDTHHVHGSYEDGTYDGKYFWVNDKIHSRIARIQGDVMRVDKITELPNVQGFHGIFPDKRDPVDAKVNRTTRVFCGSEFRLPHPNNGRNMTKTDNYYSLFTCVDAETMAVRWQCKVDGNMDLVATSFDGKLAASNQYNTEKGVTFANMMSAERDTCIFLNIARIEKAVKAGKVYRLPGSKVPIVDATMAKNKNPKTAVSCYVPVPKSPHGVNASPDGKYFICSGKLSPTVSVIELSKILEWFDGKLKQPRDAVVAEPEVGLGPLHTAFDGRGDAYTTLFLDSQIVKWNIDAAIKAFKGDKDVKVIRDRIDVHYQPGHLNASMMETKEADGKWLVIGNKFSKDRYLPVGPLHPENEQLIDISGDKMRLVHETPVYAEPHDFILVKRDRIKTRQIYTMSEFPNAVKDAGGSKVVRKGPKKVTIYLTSTAPTYGLSEFKVKQGDEVTLILTNHDKIEDLTHGLAIPKYDINFIVNPQETKSVTFVANKPGVYWCYCTHFCHALHLEMRSRLLVQRR